MLVIVALWTLALAAYANSFGAAPTGDGAVLLHDPRIAGASAEHFRQVFEQGYWLNTSLGLYRPLSTLSYLVNYTILGNGMEPGGYHFLNFALHAVNIALVYVLGMVLFGGPVPAAAMAALWGVHPVLTESVTNLAGRPDLLAGFGVLGGLLCHIAAGEARGRRKVAWLASLAAVAAVGFFSKENAVVLFGAMALYDVAYRPKDWRSVTAGYAAAALPCAAFLLARHRVLAAMPAMQIPFTDNPIISAGFWTGRLTAVKVIGKYLWRLLWPGSLSGDYSYNEIPLFGWRLDNAADWGTLAAVVVCLALAGTAAFFYRRRPAVFFVVLFFGVTLAPTSNLFIIIGSIMAERFLYLPSIAFAGGLVLAAEALRRRFPARSVAAGVAIVCLAYAVRTYARNLDWADELSLWTSAAAASPGSAKAHISLADVRLSLRPPDAAGAAVDADRAIAILRSLPDERNVAAHYSDAARIYRTMGDTTADPGRKASYYRKGLQLALEARRIDRAVSAAVRRLPGGERYATLGVADVYAELGRLEILVGEPEKAIEPLEYARLVRAGMPEDADSGALADAYTAMGRRHDAVIALLEGLAFHPGQTAFAAAAAELYREIDPQGCAASDAGGGATRLDWACPTVHQDVCTAFANVARLRAKRGEPRLRAELVRSAQGEFGCPANLY